MRMVIIILFVALGTNACSSEHTLLGINGEPHSLDEFIGKGRWVMVNVWSAGCKHCLEELPALIALHGDKEAGVAVLGIAVDYPGFGYPDRAALASFAEAQAINFPLLMADGTQASEFIGGPVDLVPITQAYHPDGRMLARWHGVITIADIKEIIQDFTTPPP